MMATDIIEIDAAWVEKDENESAVLIRANCTSLKEAVIAASERPWSSNIAHMSDLRLTRRMPSWKLC